jgi:hypothetical protein
MQASPPASNGIPPERPASFWRLLPGAFIYPFRGDGKWMVLGGGIGLLIVQWAGFVSGILGIVLGMFILGYLAMYAMRNISASAGGDREPPGWPDITHVDDTVRPLLQMVGSGIICLGPFEAYHVYMLVEGRPFAPELSYGMLAAGLFYLPMGLLAVSLHDSLRGLNPLVVLPAIVRVLPAYLASLLTIAAACAVFILAGALPGAILLVYWLMVVTHIIGLIYRGYATRLDWFGD